MSRTRKLLLLAVSALAMVAFAVPAAAQAEGPYWYQYDTGDELVGGEENPQHIEGSGTLQLAQFLCPIKIDAMVWNDWENEIGAGDAQATIGFENQWGETYCYSNFWGAKIYSPIAPKAWDMTLVAPTGPGKPVTLDFDNVVINGTRVYYDDPYHQSKPITLQGTLHNGAIDGAMVDLTGSPAMSINGAEPFFASSGELNILAGVNAH